MIEHHRKLVDWLAARGATSITLDRRKHMHIHFMYQGEPHTFVTASTPSDAMRGTAKALRDLRHMLGLVGGAKKVGERRQRSGRAAPRRRIVPPRLTAGADWRAALTPIRPTRRALFLSRLITAFRRYAEVSA